jgi:hypothetical protein
VCVATARRTAADIADSAPRDRPRLALQARGGQPHDGFKKDWRDCTPRAQHGLLVFSQAVITMGSRMLVQRAPQPLQRLDDSLREVLDFTRLPPDPPLLRPATGLFL